MLIRDSLRGLPMVYRLSHSGVAHASLLPRSGRSVVAALGLYAVLGGLTSFIGWAADIPRLTDWINSGISIQPNTCVAVMAAGAAVILLAWGHRRAAAVLGLLVALIGSSVLFEYFSGVDLGIDRVLMFGRTWGNGGVLSTGRMGPPGATSWTLIGTALVLVATGRRGSRARALAVVLAFGAFSLAGLSVTGYLYSADILYTLPRLTVIALQTSSFVLATTLAIIAAVREHAPTRWFIENSSAGMLARRALPFVILVPFAVGWLRVRGQELGLYNTAFGTALFVLVLVALLVGFMSWNLSMLSRHEAVLRRSERRLGDTLESITDGFIGLDDEWRFTFVNIEAERLLTKTRDELIGRSVWDVFPEVMGTTADKELRRSATDRVSVEFEDFNPVLQRWFANKAYPMADGGMTVYFQDVTVRKAAEEGLRVSQEQLRAELMDMKRVQELSLRLVQAGDMRSLLGEILAAATEITGTSKGNIQFYDPITGRLRIIVHQGLSPQLLEHFADDGCVASCGAAAAKIERVIVEDVASEPNLQGTLDLKIMLADGIRAILSTPLVSRDGQLLGMLSNHFDVSRRPSEREQRYLDLLARMAADLIERSQTELALREADRRKDEFLAILAHELRNPLAPLRNAAHIMKLKELSDPELVQPIDMIERQTAQMARLIDDLLDVSRITRGIVDLRLEPVEFGDVAKIVVESCRSEIDPRGHTLYVDLPKEPVVLKADRHRLIQIFSNLIVNAAKYTPSGGRIDFTARVDDRMLDVHVKDSGVGIPRGKLGEIFELFAQLDRSLERQGGLGIGLTLARQLVVLHRGTIAAHSDGVGQGSTFVVRRPVAAVAVAPVARAEPEPATRPKRILVVDDNADAAESLALIMRVAGHEVRLAADGVDALRVAAEFVPEVAFLDIGMPRLNGYETARRMREEPWGKSVYLIAMTGWGQQNDRQRSERAGFDAHVVKPASPGALQKMVRDLDHRAATNST